MLVLQLWRADELSGLVVLDNTMSINKAQVAGRAGKATGKVKEVVGKVIGNPKVEVKKSVQKNIGANRATVGDAEAELSKAKRNR